MKVRSGYWINMRFGLAMCAMKSLQIVNALKLKAVDGKRCLADIANREQPLRLIQSILSKATKQPKKPIFLYIYKAIRSFSFFWLPWLPKG